MKITSDMVGKEVKCHIVNCSCHGGHDVQIVERPKKPSERIEQIFRELPPEKVYAYAIAMYLDEEWEKNK